MPKKTNFTVNGSNYYRVTATVGKATDGTPIALVVSWFFVV